MEKQQSHRIESIDLLRGLVMILMVLDHARKYFGYGSFFANPEDLSTTTPLLFLTRWITHFCAPVFVFLAGTAAFLYGSRTEKTSQVSWFLLTRGLWLILLELTIVNFGWTFDITLGLHILQVIWAIGFSMVCLSALVYLPKWALVGLGFILVAGHNLLDSVIFEEGVFAWIWSALHFRNVLLIGSERAVVFAYPLIPWIGLMVLGYAFGNLYKKGFDANKRKKLLLILGTSAIAAFVVLRLFNIYGDSSSWNNQGNHIYSVMSFFNTTKYPPSLLFLLMTIGPSLLFLYFTEDIHNKVTKAVIVLGRVPLFFYVIHIYVLHFLAIFGLIAAGRAWTEYIMTIQVFSNTTLADFGFGLPVVYLIWIIVTVALFPVCKRYMEYKANNRAKWWLSYL
ncbi:hypothetical protein CEE37_13545 [candidate division LCP-89 bacterium B3_LCP]|uniref:Heparan-alpha-glucosaminide N-acetyltransferase catalytic domain-containing protein n=1 Tax=candidate division LCP-89 bacterium B3_LCP TaxID=2012998 RepID=A0A532UST5_UNCL8|nr:MAG: hypothetical protein CEE37_13545 [candidate division LCP-89 bacterium B3_LCP]